MAKRKSLSKKVRFEVFKRDKFACQYCGMKAPEVVLVVDHVHPVSKGGKNDLLNLITACAGCNGGKSDRLLADDSAVTKQRQQLIELQERREQIEMMVAWQKGLASLTDHATDQVGEFYSALVPGWSLNEQGRSDVRSLLAKYPLEVVLEELRSAVAKHVRIVDGKATEESVHIACRVFYNTCRYREQRARDPIGSELRYIRGILRNTVGVRDEETALAMLTAAYAKGTDLADLRSMAQRARSWSAWRTAMTDLLVEAE